MKDINTTSSLKPPRKWLEIILPHGFSVIPFNARVALQLWDLSPFGSLKASANRLRGKMLLLCTETSSFSRASASQIFSKAAFHIQFMYGLMFLRNFNFPFCILVSKEIQVCIGKCDEVLGVFFCLLVWPASVISLRPFRLVTGVVKQFRQRLSLNQALLLCRLWNSHLECML